MARIYRYAINIYNQFGIKQCHFDATICIVLQQLRTDFTDQ